MRIGIDARFLQSPRRGQGQYVYYLIKELLGSDSGDEYVAFYNGFAKGRFAFADTARLRQVWCRAPGTMLKYMWKAFGSPSVECFTGRLDVFHNPANFSLTHYGPVPSRAPMVATFNGMVAPSDMWASPDEAGLEAWLHALEKSAAILIVISEMAKKDLLRHIDFPQDRIRTIYYGVDGDFRPIPDKAAVQKVLSRYGLAGKRYIFYAGGAEPNKNLDRLLEVFGALSRSSGMEGVHLVLAGAIDQRYKALAEKTTVLGIDQKTVFIGYVSHDDLPFVYNGADVFVLPTLSEWFGIPVLEALACGIGAVVSKNTGAIEAVGDSVVTFDPYDGDDMARSIREAVLNQDLRGRMRSKGLEAVKDLSWRRMAEKTRAVYEEAYRLGKR